MPEPICCSWPGRATNSTQMWDALNQQGAFDKSTVVTGLADKATQTGFTAVADKLSLLAHYFDGATDNEVEQALVGRTDEGGQDAGPLLAGRLQRRADAGPRGRDRTR